MHLTIRAKGRNIREPVHERSGSERKTSNGRVFPGLLHQEQIKNPNVVVDYTYYDDPENFEEFERNALYHYSFMGDKLIIGKFCAGRASGFSGTNDVGLDGSSMHA